MGLQVDVVLYSSNKSIHIRTPVVWEYLLPHTLTGKQQDEYQVYAIWHTGPMIRIIILFGYQ